MQGDRSCLRPMCRALRDRPSRTSLATAQPGRAASAVMASLIAVAAPKFPCANFAHLRTSTHVHASPRAWLTWLERLRRSRSIFRCTYPAQHAMVASILVSLVIVVSPRRCSIRRDVGSFFRVSPQESDSIGFAVLMVGPVSPRVEHAPIRKSC